MTKRRGVLSAEMVDAMRDFKTAWITKSDVINKPWGTEIAWSTLINGIHGKLLKINAGEMTSLKYYHLKDEVLFLLSGSVTVKFGNEATLTNEQRYPFTEQTLVPGDSLNVQSGCPYRVIALEDSQLIEIGNARGTPVRVDDKYGRADSFEKGDEE